VSILKPVHSSIFEQSQELKQEFGNVPQIRHHIDDDEGQNILVYKFAISNVLETIYDCPPLPLQARKTILKEVGLALKNMHARNWIHLGKLSFFIRDVFRELLTDSAVVL
jgi:hypothetical protein